MLNMSRTPWNWIITAFVLAAMFLTSFGMYRKEVKSSNPLKIIELQKEIRRKDKVIADKDKQITNQQSTIDNLNKENAKRIVYITDNETVNELKKSINSKNQEIKQLEGQVRDLRQKIQWYIDNCN